MDLGTQTNSVLNHVYSEHTIGIQPRLGMGVTILYWTDRRAGTIYHVETLKDGRVLIGVRMDQAIPKHVGLTESQAYEYKPGPMGDTHQYVLDRNGNWREVQLSPKNRFVYVGKTKNPLILGIRDHYIDPNF